MAEIGSNTIIGTIPGTLITSEAELETAAGTPIQSEAEASSDIGAHNSAVTAHGQVAGVFPISKGGTGSITAPLARTALGTDAAGDARPPTAHTQAIATISDAGVKGQEVVQATDSITVRDAIKVRLDFEATSDPTVNNDEADTAAIGTEFSVGDVWQRTNVSPVRWWKADSVAPGAAVWSQFNPAVFATAAQGTDARQDSVRNGLVDGSKFPFSHDPTTQVFTVTVAAGAEYWAGGVKYNPAAGATVAAAHADTTGTWWLVWRGATLTAVSSIVFETDAWVGRVYHLADAPSVSKLYDERHPNTWSFGLHQYEHLHNGALVRSGGAISGYTLNTGGDSNTSVAIAETVHDDESLSHTLSALAQGGPYSIWFRDGSTYVWEDSPTTSFIDDTYALVPGAGDEMCYDNAGVLTAVAANNRWVNYWVFSTSAYADAIHRYSIVVGQTLHTSAAAAAAESVLTGIAWSGLPFQEWAPLWKLTYRRVVEAVEKNVHLSAVTRLVGTQISLTSTASPSVHNSLSGRDDDGAHPATAITLDDSTLDPVFAGIDDVQELAEALGTAAAEDVGVAVGNVVQFADDGGGNPQYPAGDGSLLTGIAVTGWQTILDQSFAGTSQAALEVLGFVFVAGAGSFSFGASDLIITAPSGSIQEWSAVTYNAPRIKYPLDFDAGDIIRVYASIRIDAVNDQGGALILDWDGAGAYWYQTRKYRSGGNLALDVKYATNSNDYAVAVGTTDEGWIGMQCAGSYAQGIWSDTAWAAGVPASWTRPAAFRARKPREAAFHISLCGLSWGSFPGCTIDFGRLVIQRYV